MNILVASMRSRPVTWYYALAVVIASAVVVYSMVVFSTDADAAAAFGALGGDIRNAGGYINIPWIVRFALQEPPLFGIFVFALAPTISALIVASATGRLKSLLSMLTPWASSVSARRALVAYALLFAFLIAGAAIFVTYADRLHGHAAVAATLARLGESGLAIVPLAFLSLFLDEGGSLEEIGWRGFALPRVMHGRGSFGAALIIGVLWWAWHLPREASTLLTAPPLDDFLINQVVFLALCLALSIVITFFWNRVGGSVWPGVLIHGGTNVWSKLLGGPIENDFSNSLNSIVPGLGILDLRTLIVLAAALAIVVLSRGGLGGDGHSPHKVDEHG